MNFYQWFKGGVYIYMCVCALAPFCYYSDTPLRHKSHLKKLFKKEEVSSCKKEGIFSKLISDAWKQSVTFWTPWGYPNIAKSALKETHTPLWALDPPHSDMWGCCWAYFPPENPELLWTLITACCWWLILYWFIPCDLTSYVLAHTCSLSFTVNKGYTTFAHGL